MNLFEAVSVLILCIVISIFFSISEISLAAARRLKLTQLADNGTVAASKVLALQASPGAFFTLIQIGLNSVAILAGIVSEAQFSPAFATLVRLFYNGDLVNQIAAALAFGTVTLSFILFADLVPKRIAMNHPETIAMRVVGPMNILIRLFKPLVLVINGIANLFFKLVGLKSERIDDITNDDLYAMVEAGAAAGLLRKEEHQVIENVFEMQRQWVTTAMTPRENLVFLSLSDSSTEIHAKLNSDLHSRLLLCKENIDEVIGYIDAKAFLSQSLNGEPLSIEQKMIQQVITLPDTLNLFEAMEQFRANKSDFAIVLNEYALVVGVVTIKDLMSTVMGDWAQAGTNDQIIQRDTDSWLIDGLTPITDVMRALEINYFPDPHQYETLAGFIVYSLRKIPKVTEFVNYAGYKFEVIDIDNFKVDQVLVTKA